MDLECSDCATFGKFNTYRKVPKFSDARKLCCNLPKIQEKSPNIWVFRQKDANRIANSEDPDQTAPLGAVWSGSALFAQTYLSEIFGSLRYQCVVQFRLETRSLWQQIRHNIVSSLVTVCPSQSYIHGFVGLTSTKQGINVTCSRPQRKATRQGLEPGTPWSVVSDANHCASLPH